MTYYFISYMWRRWVKGTNYSECDAGSFRWRFSETLTQIHPVRWLIDTRDEYFKVEENKEIAMYDYQIVGWQEVPEEIYIEYKGGMG